MKHCTQVFMLLLLATSAIVIFSCKKSGTNNTTKTKTELITAGPWKRTALISTPAYDWNANGVADTNVLNIMFPCEKDNFETYYTNCVVVTNEGSSKCSPSDPQIWNSTWKFAN